jgi:hypothetical protein
MIRLPVNKTQSGIIPTMIPPENRVLLIKNLKAGWDIRHACARSKISRAALYTYYKEDPSFKIDVKNTLLTYQQRKDKNILMSARHTLRKDKQQLRNRAK